MEWGLNYNYVNSNTSIRLTMRDFFHHLSTHSNFGEGVVLASSAGD